MNVDFQRSVDRIVGVPLCRLLSLWPSARDRAEDAPAPRRILVILLSEMGSLVLARPMFERLRARYPEASLHALVFEQNKEVLALLEAVPDAEVLTLRNSSLGTLMRDALAAVAALRRKGIDTVLDCELFSRVSAILSLLSGARRRVGFHPYEQEGLYRGSFINRPVLYNPYQHIARQFLTLVEAIESVGTPAGKRVTDDDDLTLAPLRTEEGELREMERRLRTEFPQTEGRRLVLVYPGGGLLPIRAWPLESFRELVSGLVAEGFLVGIVGLASDRELATRIREACGEDGTIDFTGYTRTVRDLMLLFHFAELLVTNDGGPGHFAAMTPLRSIVLYGPETPLLYGSLDPRSVSFYTGLSCSPCLTAYNHRASPCDGDNRCLKEISVSDVLTRALEMLAAGA